MKHNIISKPKQILDLIVCATQTPRSSVRFYSSKIQLRYQFRSASVSAKMATQTVCDSEKKLITHVIFDMDGLLIDTEKFYTEVQEIILSRFNKTFDWSLKAKMMGKKAIEAARVFVEETGISDSLTAEDFLVEREAMLQKMFPTCDLMPGASRLVKHLHAAGVPICVATGSHKRHYELKTQNHGGIFSLMHHIVMGDDPEVKQGKPSPDVFLAAARRFEGGSVDPSKILVFEDAPSGVLAAKNAGMSVVMVPDPRLDSSYHETADKVLSSLLDFNPADWGLPPFTDSAT
ncbi:(DL)-glycerol-3-phosphatase 2 [Cynara cardunculus var. scolymus]|uniref:(DL)-glycerol-3-phosphatase 2 n=1 Tax=Cynara cardunculus var. scolymus TaxID=59895 RepID=UPI000D62B0FF|nr:(DL)-glycerol-3-phosphatase 2 [Cynara cardunculus var. scolymus]